MNIEEKINRTRLNMPVVEQIRKRFLEEKPFNLDVGFIRVGACLHLTKETAVLLLALKDGGADVVACASNPLSTQDDVVDYLNQNGVISFGKKGMSVKDYDNGLQKVLDSRPDYVIDDGGDLTEKIHSMYQDRFIPKGGLEQTTTGVNRIKNMNLLYPILAVNDAKTKHFFDNVYGTGQSTIDGIIRATNTLLAGKTFVVAGYGYCGRGLAQRARGMGCNVVITEIDPTKALQAYMDGFKVMKMTEAAKIGDIFVTVTGSINVITAADIGWMKKGAILANSGHFDVEINVEDVKQFSDRVTLLAEGRLVNLACAEGHPSEVMDMSFANQALGLEYIKNNKLNPGVYDIPVEIDSKVAKLKLESLDIQIDEETDEQKRYNGR